jgi:chromatin assembly factor 1 subunit A
VKNYVPYFCRKPFGQDKELFEYDYDSDDDWEEEEQGESLR